MAVLYPAFLAGQPSPLPELPIQYADFAAWQRAWLQDEVLQSQVDYWKRQLRDLPVLDLPTDRPRPPQRDLRGAVEPFALAAPLSAALARLNLGLASMVLGDLPHQRDEPDRIDLCLRSEF